MLLQSLLQLMEPSSSDAFNPPPWRGLALGESHLTVYPKYLLAQLLELAPPNAIRAVFLEHISDEAEPFVQDFLANKELPWPLHFYLWMSLNISSPSAKKRVLEGLLAILNTAKSKGVAVYGLPTFNPAAGENEARHLHTRWIERIRHRLGGDTQTGAILLLVGRLHAGAPNDFFGPSISSLLNLPSVGFEPLCDTTEISLTQIQLQQPPQQAIFGEDWRVTYPEALEREAWEAALKSRNQYLLNAD
jgi:hypothetical protein